MPPSAHSSSHEIPSTVAGSGLVYFGPVSRYLGMLAAMDGNRSLATEHYECAIQASAHIGAGPMQTLIHLEEAQMLIDGGSPYGLTRRELQVLEHLAERRTNAQIAAALFIEESAARTHVESILGKMGVHRRADAVDLARRTGVLPPSTS